MTDIRSFEHSTLKVPYELLNKKFRFAQKTIDREVSRVSDVMNELEKVLKGPSAVPIKDMDTIVESLLDKLNSLKRKASDAVADETAAATTLKKRLDHLKVVTDPNISEATLQQWRNMRVDRFVVDYLLRSGYYDTALKLASHNDMEYMTNWHVFLKAKEVAESLRLGETQKWSEWSYDNRSKLRRTKSSLELKIRQQEFVELIRRGDRSEAVKYARKHFSCQDAEYWSTELVALMGLLAFDAETVRLEKYREMFSPDRWQRLVDEFREENFRLFQLNNQSVFSACLQSGIAAMKTPKCSVPSESPVIADCSSSSSSSSIDICPAAMSTGDIAIGKSINNNSCPVCTRDVNALAKTLPYAHASHSRLVCGYSGDALNEHNPPMMLPNGRVYGQRALLEMDAINNGTIVCPKTKQTFSLADAVRVYVM